MTGLVKNRVFSKTERYNMLKIIAIYAIFSFLWIYISDTNLSLFTTDPSTLTRISVFKGFLFVIITSILLYNLVSRYLFESSQLKDEIKKSELLFNLLSESMIDAYVSTDMTGGIIQFNEVYRTLLGYEPEELLSKTYTELTPEKWHSIEKKMIEEQVVSRGYSDIYEKEYRKKDGTVFPVELRAQLVRDDQGSPMMMWAIVRDITDRKLIEERLKFKSQQLEELNQSLEKRVAESILELRQKDQVLIQQSRLAAMGEMINNIAHQWRQPLNALGLQIQSLMLEYDSGSLNKESLDMSIKEAMLLIMHMSATIDDFRTFFKPDKEKEDFNVCQTVARAVQLVKASFDNYQIKIDMKCNEETCINGYPNEFSQVIINILVNAKEALEANKTANPQVRITAGLEESRTVVIISDNAGGISDEIIHKIFDPHFSTKGPLGTGIGLFMSKNIIEKNMNGRLSVRNTSVGAEFRIDL
ncbi:MAG: PAS domain S-box protein [Proteobacteria bacterium]|nr:PAS domain S-box protein [Pseudomonadota bacterium]